MANTNNDNRKKDVALDKFDFDVTSAPRSKTNKKIKGKRKNPVARFAIAAFPQADDSAGEKARKALLLLAVAILIGTVIFLVWQVSNIKDEGDLNKSIANIANAPMPSMSTSYSMPAHIENPPLSFATSEPPVESVIEVTEYPEYVDLTPVVNTPLNVNFDRLRNEVNPDIKAWIKITGTLINNPVVQSDDNFYYLTHNIYGNNSIAGAIYSNCLNAWNGSDDNIILFGHSMLISGEFFTYLTHYVPADYLSEPLAFYKIHPTIMMATPEGGSETYKIFAGMLANTKEQYGEVFNYMNKTRFSGKDDFNNFILDVMDRSWFYTDVDLEYGDELLTLSTCYWPLGRDVDSRWVIFARKVRPGELEYVNTSVAKRNYSPKLFDYYYDVRGGSWRGSSWDRSKLLSY